MTGMHYGTTTIGEKVDNKRLRDYERAMMPKLLSEQNIPEEDENEELEE